MNINNRLSISALGIGALVMSAVGVVGCGSSKPAAAPTTAATDSDSDGVPDSDDKCPDKKEDGIGANPTDGCPNT